MDETASITLSPDDLRAVRESVEAGEYASTDAALADAVRVWRRERAEHVERIAAIKARIRRSLDDPRPSLSIDQVRANIDALHAETVKAHLDEAS